jgi:hypothetical protein
MNRGFRALSEALNEIRLAVNRIDGRLRDTANLPPVIVVSADADVEEIEAKIQEIVKGSCG